MRDSYVYLISADGTGYYKIGHSVSPENRLQSFAVLPFESKLICAIQCEDAPRTEAYLHNFFWEFRVKGEWFKLSDEHVTMISSCSTETELFATLVSSLKASITDKSNPPPESAIEAKTQERKDKSAIILSERKTKAAAALAQMTLEEINKAAGLGVGYISRKWGSDGVTLATINRVAKIIDCSALDLLEEVDPPTLEPPAKPDPAAATRQAKRNELLIPMGKETLPTLTDEERARFEAIKQERLAAAQAELARRASGK